MLSCIILHVVMHIMYNESQMMILYPCLWTSQSRPYKSHEPVRTARLKVRIRTYIQIKSGTPSVSSPNVEMYLATVSWTTPPRF